jgi:transposase-like protein
MNFNNAFGTDNEPITIRFARKVGEILSYVPEGDQQFQSSYRFGTYILDKPSQICHNLDIMNNTNLVDLARYFSGEDKARAFLEKLRWRDGVVCPHCGVIGAAYRLKPKSNGKTHVRSGVWKCSGCQEQFTVTVGTIFEDSHLPLSKWLFAIHLMCASKKGMSAHQLHRMLDITYKTAWFMAHRIRLAMTKEPFKSKLKGVVEVDETYVGGKQRGVGPGRPGLTSNKSPVVSLVERKGRVRSFQVDRVTSNNLRTIMREHIKPQAGIMTDDFKAYRFVRKDFASHDRIAHSKGKYVRQSRGRSIHTNTAEGFFSILKRGVTGVYHHWSKQHLARYLSEFDFRYNTRKTTDGERTALAICGAEGKRLTYRKPIGI